MGAQPGACGHRGHRERLWKVPEGSAEGRLLLQQAEVAPPTWHPQCHDKATGSATAEKNSVDTSTTYALTLQNQQLKSEDFNMLENTGMTSAGRGKFSTDFNAQHNETSDEKHSLRRGFSLTHADQEDKAFISRISDPLRLTEEPQAQILKPDLEIPYQAKIVSIPLCSLPSKLQQLLLVTAKNVSEVKQGTETESVIYVWPLIKLEEASRSFWNNFSKYLLPSSQNFSRHCSSPTTTEDVKCSQITPEKQEEPARKTARSYPLIVKSCNIVASEILKSLPNMRNKDYKDMLPLSSVSPIGEQLEIPFFEGNALLIYNGQAYVLYVMKHEALPAERERACYHRLMTKTVVWFITCGSIRNLTSRVPHPLLSGEDAVKQNMKCLTTCATHTPQEKTSNETHSSPHKMTTVSEPKDCSLSTGKRQQFLNKTVSPFKEGLQKRNEEAAPQDKDKELRKKFGIIKDGRLLLSRLSASELKKYTGKASAHKRKVTTRTKN